MKFGGRSLARTTFPAISETRARMVLAKIGLDRDFVCMRSDFSIELRLDFILLTVELDQSDRFFSEALTEGFVSLGGVVEVVDDFTIFLFFIVQVVSVHPGTAWMGFGEFDLGFADVFSSFQSFLLVESVIADTTDD